MNTLLPLIGILLGGALQYYVSRALEGSKLLTAQKTQAYVDYFKAVVIMQHQGYSPEKLAILTEAKLRVSLYGSTGVVRKMAEFEAAGATIISEKEKNIVAELLSEIRGDLNRRDRVALSDLRRVLLP